MLYRYTHNALVSEKGASGTWRMLDSTEARASGIFLKCGKSNQALDEPGSMERAFSLGVMFQRGTDTSDFSEEAYQRGYEMGG